MFIDNQQKLSVSTVVYNHDLLFKVKYTPSSTEISNIDIECNSAKTGETYLYTNLPLSEDSLYFLGLLPPIKDMFEISIREKSTGGNSDWISIISYLDKRVLEQTVIQKWLFGVNKASMHISKLPSNLLKAELNYPAGLEEQEMVVVPELFEGYGWGITAKYMPCARCGTG